MMNWFNRLRGATHSDVQPAPNVELGAHLEVTPSDEAWNELCQWFADQLEIHHATLHAGGEEGLATWPDKHRELVLYTLGTPEDLKERSPWWRWARALRTHELTLTPDDLEALLNTFAEVPLTLLALAHAELRKDAVERLVGSGIWRHLHHLDLSSNELGGGAIRCVTAASHSPRLRSLDLSANMLDPEGVAALGGWDGAEHLQSLNLGLNPLGDSGVVQLARSGLQPRRLGLLEVEAGLDAMVTLLDSPVVAQLEALNLGGTPLGSEGARRLRGATFCPALRKLELFACGLQPDGLEELITGATFQNLKHLDLASNHLGAQSAARLAGAPVLSQLEVLVLPHNTLGDAGVEAITASIPLGRLKRLDLCGNAIGPRGAAALATWPALAQIEVLELSLNRLGVEGARALARSPFVHGLKELWLVGDDTEGVAEALDGAPNLERCTVLT